jgi:hypothetical protein
LATGPRRLVVVMSTWGPESLLARRPGLPAELCALLPHDSFQVALVLHPNEFSRTGEFDLSRWLAPALSAGLLLARPYEEWAALLVAADAVVTDHGSTALYAAALGHAVVNAYDGGSELIPGTPMARLLADTPRLSNASNLPEILQPAEAVDTRRHAAEAFACQGQALPQLRHHLYRLLGLTPPTSPVEARPFPRPTASALRPRALAVRADVSKERIAVHRFPAHTREPVHHLAAEYPSAGPREVQSAAVLWCRAGTATPGMPSAAGTAHSAAWTAGGWTEHVLTEMPACRTAVAVLTPRRCLLRHRTAGLLSIRLEPYRETGRVSYADPAAVASAVHAWLGTPATERLPVTLQCDTGPITVRAHLAAADANDLDYEL